MNDPVGENVDVRILNARYQEQTKELLRLKNQGGGGTSGGMGQEWKDSVDMQLKQLHQDVRHLLYGLIGAAVLLAGAGWTAYSKLSEQVSEFRVLQAETNGKLDLLIERTARAPAPDTDDAPTN